MPILNEKKFKSFSVKDLRIYYRTQPIIKDLSFSIPKGQVLALMGPNGGGKTTLLNTLVGLHTHFTGKWGWEEEDGTIVPLRREDVAYLPQRHEAQRTFPLSVKQVVSMGLWHQCGLGCLLKEAHQKEIDAALAKVNLLAYRDAPLVSLSGGQYQRMFFARLIVQKAPLVLLDEPFVGIDETTIEGLMALLTQWHHEGKTVLISQHSRARVMKYFPETLLLARHFSRWGKTPDVLTSENIALAYEIVNP